MLASIKGVSLAGAVGLKIDEDLITADTRPFLREMSGRESVDHLKTLPDSERGRKTVNHGLMELGQTRPCGPVPVTCLMLNC